MKRQDWSCEIPANITRGKIQHSWPHWWMCIELNWCSACTVHCILQQAEGVEENDGRWQEEGNAILERIAAVVATKWGYATRNCMFKVERRSTRTRKAHRNATHRIAANKEVKLKDKSHDCSGGTCTCTVGPWIEATHEHTYELKYAVILKKEEEEPSSFWIY